MSTFVSVTVILSVFIAPPLCNHSPNNGNIITVIANIYWALTVCWAL